MKTADDNKSVAAIQISNWNNRNFIHHKKHNGKMTYEEWKWLGEPQKEYTIESLTGIFSSIETRDIIKASKEYAKNINKEPFRNSLNLHMQTWENHWKNAAIEINGDKQAEGWINFAIYNLISAGKFSGKIPCPVLLTKIVKEQKHPKHYPVR